ncbi:MAG: glycoside hydrolase family 13 [Desulfobulbaceae bacterium]|nr:glycoside hydrolase family 13 [Desulfobulbaceae bacterium]
MACGTKKCSTNTPPKNAPSTEFTITAPDAKEVFLVGEFNNWCGDDFRMRRYKGGVFKKKVKLRQGNYQYRFVVDNEWWTDPANPDRCPNSFGSENSIITIT